MLEGTLEVIESCILLMQGFLEPIAQHVSRQLLNVFKDADSTNSLGNLLHCSVIPTTKKGFLIIESYNNLGRDLKNDLVPTSLLWARLYSDTTSCVSIYVCYLFYHQWALRKRAWLHLFQIFIQTDMIFPSLRETVPSSLSPSSFEMLHSLNHICDSSLDTLQYVHYLQIREDLKQSRA